MAKCTTCKGYGETDVFETGRPHRCATCGGDGFVDPAPAVIYQPPPDASRTIEALKERLQRRDLEMVSMADELENAQMEIGRLRGMLVERGLAVTPHDAKGGAA